jgi:phosphoribosylamine-glycine ligase
VDDDRGLVFWTRELDADDVAALATIGPEPYLMQELIARAYDIRVTVVGDTIFAARIETTQRRAWIRRLAPRRHGVPAA